MRFARLDGNGTVLEVIDLDSEEELGERFPPELGFERVPDTVEANWKRVGADWHPPGPVEPTVEQLARWRAGARVSFRQLVLGLLQDGWIDAASAEAWAARSAIPAPLAAVIDAMPEVDRPAARITAITMGEAFRADPMLAAAASAAMPGATDQEIELALDDAFRRWTSI